MNNKILTYAAVFAFAAMFLIGGKTCAAAAVISAGSDAGNPTEIVEVPISLTTSPNASAVIFSLTYPTSILTIDPAMIDLTSDAVLDPRLGSLALEKVVQIPEASTPGTVSFFLSEYPGDPTGLLTAGGIFKVKFTIKQGAAAGPYAITISEAVVLNSSSQPISSTTSNGTITVNGQDGVDYNILKAATAPSINGELSEYQQANSIDLTISSGNAATAKALWDANNLYLAYSVADSDIQADVSDRDGAVYNEDSVEWAIDTNNDDGGSANQNATFMKSDDFHGIINAINAIYDSRGNSAATGTTNPGWNPNWTVIVRNSGSGYDVEISIPWVELDYAPQNDSIVGLGFLLNDKDGTAMAHKAWPSDKGSAFENASNWNQARLSANIVPEPTYNISNFVKIISDWLQDRSGSMGDLDGDNKINSKDLGMAMSNWGN